MKSVIGRYIVSVLLAATLSGLIYSWVITGVPLAFVYYGYPVLLAMIAAFLVISIFSIVCVLTRKPRLSAFATVAVVLVAIIAFVTVTSQEFLGYLWWRAFSLYAVFALVPPIFASFSMMVGVSRGESTLNRRI